MANLQIIISPAKRMRRSGAGTMADDLQPAGIPPFPDATLALARRLKGMDAHELQALWRTSDRLTAESLASTRELEIPQTPQEAREPTLARRLTPALLTYDGIQYRSLAPEVLDADAFDYLQRHLWVLSGLYGCVRPLDAVMPYRLEMGARLPMPAQAPDDAPTHDLYDFWGTRIARHVTSPEPLAEPDKETGEPVTVVNLASVEYARAVVPHVADISSHRAPTTCVTCVFGELVRNGRPVQRATASKVARGSMVRWMAEHALDDACDLRRFDLGYRYDEALSSPGHLVFVRA